MALYSFCVRKKGTNEYACAHVKHELAFLDYFAMQFNSKEELLKFLGAHLDKYDDIAIIYQNNHQKKILPLYFDAPELERITKSMVDFSKLNECDSIYLMLAYAYRNGKLLKIKSSVLEKSVDFERIVAKISLHNRPEVAFRTRLLNKKALEHWNNGYEDMFKRELSKSYMNVRKAYMSLRENDYISGQKNPKKVPNLTMQEIINRHIEAVNKTYDVFTAYNILKKLTLTSYEENLIVRILSDDENAYEELMASDVERLEYLKPIIDYLDERRGNAKKR